MSEVLYKKYYEGLHLRGYADKSKESYVWRVKKLSEHYLRSPEQITDEELRQYLLYLLREKKYCRATMVGIVTALRLFYSIACDRSIGSLQNVLPLGKTPERLPRLYGKDEIARLLCAEGLGIRQQAMLVTAYASGLRASEVCRLKVTDILSSRMKIYVEHGKGGNPRYAILSPKLLNILRNYWRLCRPKLWLFPSPRDKSKPIHPRTLHQTFKDAVKAAKLPNRGGIHSLRHSFATHALEAGVELPTLQHLLGHRWLSSTTMYLHVSQRQLDGAQSPLDQIDIGPETVKVSMETNLFVEQGTEGDIFWNYERADREDEWRS